MCIIKPIFQEISRQIDCLKATNLEISNSFPIVCLIVGSIFLLPSLVSKVLYMSNVPYSLNTFQIQSLALRVHRIDQIEKPTKVYTACILRYLP